MYQPEFFISVGLKNCFFTLRETYLHTYSVGGRACSEVRSHHWQNLSQDATVAVEKATEIAAQHGMPMRSTVDSIQQELNTIKRASAEEMERRQREATERELIWAGERARTDEQMREVINAGFFPFGQYAGKAFEHAELGYLNWMMDKAADFEEGSHIRLIADKLINDYAELRFPVAVPGKYTGVVGKRDTYAATVVRTFFFDGAYGRMYIIKMVAKDGACIVSKGQFRANVGEVLTFKATVKEHAEYKGEAQTVVNRVALI